MFRRLTTALRALPFWPRREKVKPAPLASVHDDGDRVMVLDSGFAASRVKGVWTSGALFSADELKDDFSPASDAAAAAFAIEARAALLSFPKDTTFFDVEGAAVSVSTVAGRGRSRMS